LANLSAPQRKPGGTPFQVKAQKPEGPVCE
jgi:hypothetical protein